MIQRELEISVSPNGVVGQLSETRLKEILEDRRKSQDQLLLTLSRCINPDTEKIYTYAELAEIFHLTPTAIQKILAKNDVHRQRLPEVRRDELPKNERAFFLGLALGDFRISHSDWGGKNSFVVVGTESDRDHKRDLLKQTIGTWGEIHEGPDGLRIYVGFDKFGYMVKPSVSVEFLRAKERFAPFLLGFLTARLTDRMNRLSSPNEAMLRKIHRHFTDHFGFSMGNFDVEQKSSKCPDESGVYRKTPVSVISVKNPGRVIGVLIPVTSVESLPFLPNLARLSPAA